MTDTSPYPSIFYCPLTGSLMSNPVIDADNNNYEKANILVWLHDRGISPITGRRMTKDELRPNTLLKESIEQALVESRERKKQQDLASIGWNQATAPTITSSNTSSGSDSTNSSHKQGKASKFLKWLGKGVTSVIRSSSRDSSPVSHDQPPRRRQSEDNNSGSLGPIVEKSVGWSGVSQLQQQNATNLASTSIPKKHVSFDYLPTELESEGRNSDNSVTKQVYSTVDISDMPLEQRHQGSEQAFPSDNINGDGEKGKRKKKKKKKDKKNEKAGNERTHSDDEEGFVGMDEETGLLHAWKGAEGSRRRHKEKGTTVDYESVAAEQTSVWYMLNPYNWFAPNLDPHKIHFMGTTDGSSDLGGAGRSSGLNREPFVIPHSRTAVSNNRNDASVMTKWCSVPKTLKRYWNIRKNIYSIFDANDLFHAWILPTVVLQAFMACYGYCSGNKDQMKGNMYSEVDEMDPFLAPKRSRQGQGAPHYEVDMLSHSHGEGSQQSLVERERGPREVERGTFSPYNAMEQRSFIVPPNARALLDPNDNSNDNGDKNTNNNGSGNISDNNGHTDLDESTDDTDDPFGIKLARQSREEEFDYLILSLRGAATVWLLLINTVLVLSVYAQNFSTWLASFLDANPYMYLLLPTGGTSTRSGVDESQAESLLSLGDYLPFSLLLFTLGYALCSLMKYTIVANEAYMDYQQQIMTSANIAATNHGKASIAPTGVIRPVGYSARHLLWLGFWCVFPLMLLTLLISLTFGAIAMDTASRNVFYETCKHSWYTVLLDLVNLPGLYSRRDYVSLLTTSEYYESGTLYLQQNAYMCTPGGLWMVSSSVQLALLVMSLLIGMLWFDARGFFLTKHTCVFIITMVWILRYIIVHMLQLAHNDDVLSQNVHFMDYIALTPWCRLDAILWGVLFFNVHVGNSVDEGDIDVGEDSVRTPSVHIKASQKAQNIMNNNNNNSSSSSNSNNNNNRMGDTKRPSSRRNQHPSKSYTARQYRNFGSILIVSPHEGDGMDFSPLDIFDNNSTTGASMVGASSDDGSYAGAQDYGTDGERIEMIQNARRISMAMREGRRRLKKWKMGMGNNANASKSSNSGSLSLHKARKDASDDMTMDYSGMQSMDEIWYNADPYQMQTLGISGDVYRIKGTEKWSAEFTRSRLAASDSRSTGGGEAYDDQGAGDHDISDNMTATLLGGGDRSVVSFHEGGQRRQIEDVRNRLQSRSKLLKLNESVGICGSICVDMVDLCCFRCCCFNRTFLADGKLTEKGDFYGYAGEERGAKGYNRNIDGDNDELLAGLGLDPALSSMIDRLVEDEEVLDRQRVVTCKRAVYLLFALFTIAIIDYILICDQNSTWFTLIAKGDVFLLAESASLKYEMHYRALCLTVFPIGCFVTAYMGTCADMYIPVSILLRNPLFILMGKLSLSSISTQMITCFFLLSNSYLLGALNCFSSYVIDSTARESLSEDASLHSTYRYIWSGQIGYLIVIFVVVLLINIIIATLLHAICEKPLFEYIRDRMIGIIQKTMQAQWMGSLPPTNTTNNNHGTNGGAERKKTVSHGYNHGNTGTDYATNTKSNSMNGKARHIKAEVNDDEGQVFGTNADFEPPRRIPGFFDEDFDTESFLGV